MRKNYKLRFLPLFEIDLNDIIDYIVFELNNYDAAADLISEVERAIKRRLDFAESFEPYPSAKQREHPYYRIRIKNYTIFYIVIDDVMEIHRIIYDRRNLDILL